jgi:hypothetical protein
MKWQTGIVVMALTCLGACVSWKEVRQDAAWQKCQSKADKAQRAACMKQAMRDLDGEAAAQAAANRAEENAAEQREAILEGQGIPREEAQKVF